MTDNELIVFALKKLYRSNVKKLLNNSGFSLQQQHELADNQNKDILKLLKKLNQPEGFVIMTHDEYQDFGNKQYQEGIDVGKESMMPV